MLIDIYLALMGIASLFAVASFVQYSVSSLSGQVRNNVFLAWFAAVMFLSLSLASANIQYQHCAAPVASTNLTQSTNGNVTDYSYFNGQANGAERFDTPFQCTTFDVEQTGMIYLNGGIGLLMLVFAIINTIELIPGLLRTPR